MPCCRIESISSCSASGAKFLRGCSALGTMFARLIWCTLSPDSPVSARVAADGVPINAPRPLPRPDRAMRLRLREQFHQRKQQSAIRAASCARRSSPLPNIPPSRSENVTGQWDNATMEGGALRCLTNVPGFYAWGEGSRSSPLQSLIFALPTKKFKKNVLTPKAEIWYHAPLAPK
jgi:hypothetical protein